MCVCVPALPRACVMCVNSWLYALGVCVYECVYVCVTAYACVHVFVRVCSYKFTFACASVALYVFVLSYLPA